MLTVVAVLALALNPQSALPTLREELQKHGLEATGVEDADRRITSYQVLNDSQWFAIGYYYYWDDGSNRLPEILHVRTYDKRARQWQQAELKGEFGSILRLDRGGRWWYVSGHLSPSAAPTLVLSDDLRLVRTLKGRTELVLPDGRLVYQHSMIHFAPAHPGSLGLYDPATNRDVLLFPSSPTSAGSEDSLVNRTFTDLAVSRAPSRITFSVDEQHVRLTPSNAAEPVGAVRRLRVTCDLSAKPLCAVR
jgi:hypothetical protein